MTPENTFRELRDCTSTVTITGAKALTPGEIEAAKEALDGLWSYAEFDGLPIRAMAGRRPQIFEGGKWQNVEQEISSGIMAMFEGRQTK